MRLALVLALWSVAYADNSVPPAGKKTRVMATLERTMCFGTCPVYRLTIFSDGRVEWEGKNFVKVPGKASAQLSAVELQSLRVAFEYAHYFELNDKYDCYEVTDAPSANTSYDDGKRKKAIPHYHGCRTPPGIAALSTLEGQIDQIVRSERWVGTEAEREQLRKSGKLR
jgi:hypothetical protein